MAVGHVALGVQSFAHADLRFCFETERNFVTGSSPSGTRSAEELLRSLRSVRLCATAQKNIWKVLFFCSPVFKRIS